jgi:hypothetical protein
MDDRYDHLVAALRIEFPRFRIVRKDRSALHRAIHYALRVITFGKMTSYLDSFTTTIGQTIYVTADWDEWTPIERYLTLRHEAVHLRQFRTFTLPGMAILYVLLPVPMGLAWFRAYFEKQAYAESIRATAEVRGLRAACDPSYRNAVISNFTGPAYGWMWPFRAGLDRWYDQILATLSTER